VPLVREGESEISLEAAAAEAEGDPITDLEPNLERPGVPRI